MELSIAGHTILSGSIRVQSVNDVYHIDADTEPTNLFILSSDRGYRNEFPTLDKALAHARKRVKEDKADAEAAWRLEADHKLERSKAEQLIQNDR